MNEKLIRNTRGVEIGVDEAGRGCICGDVYAAAVIVPTAFNHDFLYLINDSKKLSRNKRAYLRDMIQKYLPYGIGSSTLDEIYNLNILGATMLAMNRAIDNLKYTRHENDTYIIVDGNYFTGYKDIPYECVVKGDGKHISIAAASILAKENHDEHILSILKDNPTYEIYGWRDNMGYPTSKHLDALRVNGCTEYHRKGYKPIRNLVNI